MDVALKKAGLAMTAQNAMDTLARIHACKAGIGRSGVHVAIVAPKGYHLFPGGGMSGSSSTANRGFGVITDLEM